tara:strand:+ start:487 stop:780 length:294 start_codon:yes stop_codon:yes gene_type:complete
MNENNFKRIRAAARVKRLKGFYTHLLIFVIVMTVVVALGFNGKRVCFICLDSSDALTNLLGFTPWAVALLIHGFVALGKIPFIDQWEERKLRQFMKE